MTPKERSKRAWILSIVLHLLLIIILPFVGVWNFTNKKNIPIEVVFFDDGGGGGKASKSVAVATPPTPTSPINIPNDAIPELNAKQEVPSTQNIAPQQNVGRSYEQGNGSLGEGTGGGSGSGTGSGQGTGSGEGNGSGSGINNNPAVPPRTTFTVTPEYPQEARRNGTTGVVRVRALVNASGSVEDVDVYSSSGHDALDRSALQAVAKWEFTAARDGNGRKVACYTIVPIRFNLQ